MTSRRDIDPAEAAQITKRIGQFFNFVRDAIHDPQIIEVIPDGSMLMFRDISHHGQSIRLTAFLPKHSGARWGARVSGAAPSATTDAPPPIEAQVSPDHNRAWPSVADYNTPDAALDALESEVRALSLSGSPI